LVKSNRQLAQHYHNTGTKYFRYAEIFSRNIVAIDTNAFEL